MRKWGRIGGVALLISTLLSPLQYNVVGAAGVDRENISYINMDTTLNWDSYKKHIDSEAAKSELDVVSPNYYKLIINKAGEEVLQTNTIKEEFITEMHKKERDIRVVPFLYNDWNNNLTLENIDAYVEKIANDVSYYKFDGINIDLENIDPAYKNRLTVFVQKLRGRLSPEKQVSIAVAAVPTGTPTGWQKTYDYKNIAEALTGPNDYIVIMAYDEFGTIKGPVARDSFVEKSIKYAINQGIPKQKIVLGIPLYGLISRDTDSETTQIEHWKILGDPTNPNYPSIIKTFNPKITYVESTPVAEFELKQDTSYKINSEYTLKAGKYKVWYDDENSIKKKLFLVQKYNLKGAASWSLAQEYTPMWNYYNDWLNKEYILTKPVVNPVDILSENITGKAEMGSTVYVKKGNQPIGQASVKDGKFSIPVFGLIGDTTLILYAKDDAGNKSAEVTVTVKVPITFTDLEDVPWAIEAIETMASLGVINGVGNNKYAPENNVTRAQFAKLIIKTLGITGTASEPFTDVNSTNWFYNDVALAYKYKIINGVSSTEFAPNRPITRQEMAVMMARAINIKQSIKAKDITGTLSTFKDRNQIDTWAKESVAIAVEQGLMNGVTTTTFSPKTNATRAQSAVIMYRFYNKFMK